MENNTFNINRFGLLCSRQFAEIRKSLMWEALTIFGTLIAIFFINGKTGHYSQCSQWNLFAILFLFVGMYYTKIFTKLRTGSQGLFEITLPASKLEKLLCVILFSAIAFPILFTVLYFAANYTSYLIFNNIRGFDMELMTFERNYRAMPFNVALVIMLVLQSCYMLGMLWFKKHNALKTTIALGCFFTFIGLAFALFSYLTTNLIGASAHTLAANEALNAAMDWVFSINKLLYAIPPFMWVTAYFRLGEKEI